MKTFFIIPGFKETNSAKKYIALKRSLSRKGYKVHIVPITWKYRTMSDYILEFEEFYAENKSAENYVLGFSYGAVTAFSSAQKLKPNKTFLCSLSPDFSEDVVAMHRSVRKYIGARRLKDCKKRNAREIASNLKVPCVVFYGEKEAELFPQIAIRAKETKARSKTVKLVKVKNAPHDISFPSYKAAIEQELSFLN